MNRVGNFEFVKSRLVVGVPRPPFPTQIGFDVCRANKGDSE